MWLTTALIIVPTLLYPAIWVGYRRRLAQKRLELASVMTVGKQNSDLYRQAFGINPDQLFTKSFGIVAYAVPVVINSLCVFVLTVTVLTRGGVEFAMRSDIKALLATNVPSSVVAAVLGAFVWGMYDALSRYRAASLTPESLHFTWLRMLIGGSLAPFIAVLFNYGGAADAVAFGLGAFPAKTLNDFIQSQAASRLSISTSSTPAESPTLQSLQGMTVPTIQTLAEADIDSCQDLAYADPLKLFLRTNISWKVALDFIDQALLFNYIGNDCSKLRPLGIRGSIELAAMHESTGDQSSDDPKAIVARIAELMNQPVEAVHNLVDTVYYDYQVKLMAALWGDAFASPASERAATESQQPAVPAPLAIAGPAVYSDHLADV